MRRSGLPFLILLLTFACANAALAAEKPAPPVAPPKDKPAAAAASTASTLAGLTEEDLAAFSKRFETELWPLLTRGNNSCVACHDAESESQLHLPETSDAAFKRLLTEMRFDPRGKSSLLARILTDDKKKRMPKAPAKPWTADEAAVLRAFGGDLHGRMTDTSKMDEQFPMELLAEFSGRLEAAGPDNTFITYYQLKRKVKAIFDDDWRRNGKDLFVENIAQFGGADFVRSYNESAVASASFLGGMDALAADLASRAYNTGSGPFAGRTAGVRTLPLRVKSPDESYRKEINQLFNRILFRDATEAEMENAWRLFQNVHRQQEQLAQSAQELRFELTVSDDEGQSTKMDFAIPVSSSKLGLFQEFVNQNAQEGKDEIIKHKLAREFTFRAAGAGETPAVQPKEASAMARKALAEKVARDAEKAEEEEQRFQISNTATAGNVSIAGIELIGPLPEKTAKTIFVSDPSVQVLGAWILKDKPFASYEDNNEDKGSSSIAIPIRVEKSGKYELSVLWRRNDAKPAKDKKGKSIPALRNAPSVMVEVLSHDATRHASPPLKPVPPKGEAHFFIDQTFSNAPFTDLKTVFQFGPDGGVELNNTGTQRQVVADAVYFVRNAGGGVGPASVPAGEKPAVRERLLVRGNEAEGNAKWKNYDPGRFKPYNTVGPKLFTDENAQKGELKLFYKPAGARKTGTEAGPTFDPDQFYGVQLVCPGKAGNETEAPVIVRAQRSSPIIQASLPLHVLAGGEMTLDASATYNLQRGKLNFSWVQTSGPQAQLSDPRAAKVTFTAPAMRARQAAWEGLCRALLKHPDFLFTRPPSVATMTDKKTRQRLQLVKIAQDLIGRTPNGDEIKRLEQGQPLAKFVDEFLESKEFRDFYFHRIRLTLESHGSESDDEPTRLWSYVCFNDRPFKEILTADYTVDKNFQKKERPAHHGKSGLLTMKGFIDGKPGLPHYNYSAVVCEKFLGYVFEVPPSIVAMREGATAATLTSPETSCYTCHKLLTPLAYQRLKWNDKGDFITKQDNGKPIDSTDRNLVPTYPYKGDGMEAFALQAQNKERFIRTMIQTHFVFYFGREMRHEDAERVLYKRLWENAHANNFSIRAMLRALMNSPEYLEARPVAVMRN